MLPLLDRLVLKGPHPSIRAVVLPPAFAGAPYSVYLLGPTIPQLQILAATGERIPAAQRITGTAPLWSQARSLIECCSMPFYVPMGDEYVPHYAEFPELPDYCPFSKPGSGWLIVRDAPGEELAVRRGPLMYGTDPGVRHPYSYVVAGRTKPHRNFGVNLCAVPDRLVDFFPEFQIGSYLRDLQETEIAHPEVFLAPCN